MKTRIVKIGNSQGIRIPKILLDQTGLHDEVEILVESDCLIIQPSRKPRAGWEESFAVMAEKQDDGSLDSIDEIQLSFDKEEWKWK